MRERTITTNGIELHLTERDDVHFVPYDPAEPIPAEHEDAAVLIVWGTPDAHLKDAAKRLSRLRWVQALSAGTDAVVAAGFGSEVLLTSGRSLHDRPVAEHALALVLAAARRLHTLVRAQIGHRWANEIGGVQREPSPGLFSTLRDARVLIWGFGSIGQQLARVLHGMGAEVSGVARSAGERDGFPVIAEEQIEDALPETDVLVMILPGMESTRHALNAERLAALPAHAYVVNVGRGMTVDEDALISALEKGSIAGAGLDVASAEPLPADSPLWDAPNLILTPHMAGGRADLGAELIRENLTAYLDGAPLKNVIAR